MIAAFPRQRSVGLTKRKSPRRLRASAEVEIKDETIVWIEPTQQIGVFIQPDTGGKDVLPTSPSGAKPG